jgi:pepF/M3 family oligoendopeptidase
MPHTDSVTWDLEALLPGGPDGAPFLAEHDAIAGELAGLVRSADALADPPDLASFASLLLEFEALGPRLEQLSTFTGCHAAADAGGRVALRADARVGDLWASWSRAWVVPNSRLVRMSEAAFQGLLATPSLAAMRGMLTERRDMGRFRQGEKEEGLTAELARDGVSGWATLYDVEAGALRIPLDRGDGLEQLSPGQAVLLIHGADRALAHRAFEAVVAGWRSIGRTCATALTHITGWRQTLNDRRGLDHLDEPLHGAKIRRETLDAILQACRQARPLIRRYLAGKARALSIERLAWPDVYAPVGTTGGAYAYGDAQDFITRQFSAFAPRLGAFAGRALAERWVEVEDRAGKRGGGFCADAPLSRQSRIFMTWGSTDQSVSTLAHELGHAYHNEVLYAVPVAQRRVPMTLAETASTFAEALVREASLAEARDPGHRLRLLDASLNDAMVFLCNIPARFELECALYRMRREGPLEAEALEAETTRIFSSWFGDAVSSVDPTFWASKLHFYIASIAFYNFPYTFGYLFSNLVYQHYRPMGTEGLPAYERLLRRTGDEWAEPIAAGEMGLDLTKVETWERAMGGVERDLREFEAAVAATRVG